MKTFIFLVVLVLFGLSVYYLCHKKGKCKTTPSKAKDKRVESIKRAQKNLHPEYNKGVDRGANGRFTKKR
tara:strand:- start:5641 stop:5850 length:210 start_codon:yes stop_codon:yes gene_type:complete